ncbi:MAG: hypothetical protein IPO04_08190 [Cytophagaceae bacterium]|nr:hypothetical protein [Cytophagaceae bacterium]
MSAAINSFLIVAPPHLLVTPLPIPVTSTSFHSEAFMVAVKLFTLAFPSLPFVPFVPFVPSLPAAPLHQWFQLHQYHLCSIFCTIYTIYARIAFTRPHRNRYRYC